jgi:hypothetical protein
MANPEHLQILTQGVEVWNQWRSVNETVTPDLNTAYLGHRDLSGARLWRADLRGVDLSHTNLRGADLRAADLAEANLLHADLCGADLTRADLSLVNLLRVDLSHANLQHSLLILTNLYETKLVNADLLGAMLSGTTISNIDLSEVKNLHAVEHLSPSSVSIDTIYKSHGNIPEKFLRGCGVPEDFITYMHSLTGKAIEFYTCFISFTEADDTFSERLYNDMQAARVRCWRWKEDAKWGKTLMRSIDEAVRVYDKLIVICSEQSLNSPAVIREIERALQKEDVVAREGKEAEVLFPIRLDDYIFTGWQHHRKADVVAKNVGDFRQWTEPESYKKALQRLIRDLKAEARKQ